MIFFLLSLLFWLSAWCVNIWIARQDARNSWTIFPPILFGLSLILIWEATILCFEVSPVILPPPSAIFLKLISSGPILWADFVQTVIKGALSGYLFGCLSALLLALVVDRFQFLERGLLPIGNFMAAMPIIGIAPILVMWYGYGWHGDVIRICIIANLFQSLFL